MKTLWLTFFSLCTGCIHPMAFGEATHSADFKNPSSRTQAPINASARLFELVSACSAGRGSSGNGAIGSGGLPSFKGSSRSFAANPSSPNDNEVIEQEIIRPRKPKASIGNGDASPPNSFIADPPKITSTKIPLNTFLEDVKFGDPLDDDKFSRQLVRREGPISHPGKLVKQGNKFILVSRNEKFIIDVSEADAKTRKKLESLVGEEDVLVRGKLQYLIDRRGPGRENYSGDRQKFARNDVYRIFVSEAGIAVP